MAQKENLAYIGGLMDGDGSFTVARRTNKKGVNLLYYPLVQFGSLSKESVQLMKDMFNGSIHLQKSHSKKDGSLRRDFYRWRIEKCSKCLPFLEMVIPYLEIKKERAEFLRDFIVKNPFKRGSNALTSHVLESRHSDYIRMNVFNDERTLERSIVRQSKKITQDSLFWAYLAGLLDSDGSFSIKKERSGRYSAQILLTQTDIRGINKIRKNTPFGTVFLVNAKSAKLGACYRFGIYSREEISSLIPYILPYLRTKKEQAHILLDFCNNKTLVQHRRNGIPNEEINFRESCYKKIIMLNKYGVYKPTLIDLETQRMGDRAEGESHGERLSERDHFVDVDNMVCDSLNTTNI